MQLPANALQRAKNVVHGIQGLVIFLAWAVTIGVFTKAGKTDGRTKYFFTLVSLGMLMGADEERLTSIQVLALHTGFGLPIRGTHLSANQKICERLCICGR